MESDIRDNVGQWFHETKEKTKSKIIESVSLPDGVLMQKNIPTACKAANLSFVISEGLVEPPWGHYSSSARKNHTTESIAFSFPWRYFSRAILGRRNVFRSTEFRTAGYTHFQRCWHTLTLLRQRFRCRETSLLSRTGLFFLFCQNSAIHSHKTFFPTCHEQINLETTFEREYLFT